MVLTLAVLFLTGRWLPGLWGSSSLGRCDPPSWAQGPDCLLGPSAYPLPAISAQSQPDLGLPSHPQGARLGTSGSTMNPGHPGIK